ncbi:MAG: D-arabinono-1,4-lactone oxidase [Acidobacteriota bacterium]
MSIAAEKGDAETWTNWSGRLECRPERLEEPESVDELAAAVETSDAVRVAGSGHSFYELVPTDATLLSLCRLSGLTSVDEASSRAELHAGTTIRDAGPLLEAAGLALANQGDIDCQALAGAVATGTHGTGRSLGCIASGVTDFELVTADGDVVSAADRPDLLQGGAVSLGALGVFSKIEVQAVPRYNLRERVWAEPIEDLLSRWETLAASHRHFEFFAFPFTGLAMAKTLDEEPWQAAESSGHAADSSGGTFAQLLELNRENPQQARELFKGGLSNTRPTEDFGPSHRVFPSDRDDLFNEMEYAVPLERGPDCLRAVLRAIEEADLPVLFPIEFRTVAPDELWLSPFYQRPSAVLAVHQYAAQECEPVFEVAEPVLREHEGRPHWGKIHTLGPEDLARLYPRWNDFLALRQELDPRGKFLNPALRKLFGVAA